MSMKLRGSFIAMREERNLIERFSILKARAILNGKPHANVALVVVLQQSCSACTTTTTTTYPFKY